MVSFAGNPRTYPLAWYPRSFLISRKRHLGEATARQASAGLPLWIAVSAGSGVGRCVPLHLVSALFVRRWLLLVVVVCGCF